MGYRSPFFFFLPPAPEEKKNILVTCAKRSWLWLVVTLSGAEQAFSMLNVPREIHLVHRQFQGAVGFPTLQASSQGNALIRLCLWNGCVLSNCIASRTHMTHTTLSVLRVSNIRHLTVLSTASVLLLKGSSKDQGAREAREQREGGDMAFRNAWRCVSSGTFVRTLLLRG